MDGYERKCAGEIDRLRIAFFDRRLVLFYPGIFLYRFGVDSGSNLGAVCHLRVGGGGGDDTLRFTTDHSDGRYSNKEHNQKLFHCLTF